MGTPAYHPHLEYQGLLEYWYLPEETEAAASLDPPVVPQSNRDSTTMGRVCTPIERRFRVCEARCLT